ncbi:MAG TPA: protease pro-enzyme activation domain-containing protein, partial [Chloroflexota bacterium]|nr:protease pro-enzyme activation domain-containing protein [Chloroflexota bacterium]
MLLIGLPSFSPDDGSAARSSPAADTLVRLPGHVLPALAHATPVPAAPDAADETITLTIVLNHTDQPGFDRYLHDVYDPASSSYRRFLSPEAIVARFGPTPEAYERVLAYLEGQGLTLVQGSANRLTLTVRGTRAQAERAFAVQLREFMAGDQQFVANTTDPAVPADLAPAIGSVAGLATLAMPKPANEGLLGWMLDVYEVLQFELEGANAGLASASEAGNAAELAIQTQRIERALIVLGELRVALAAQRAALFGGGALPAKGPGPRPSSPGRAALAAATGTGQKIGIPAFSSIRLSDVADWLAVAGLPASLLNQVTQVPVNGGAPLTSAVSDVLVNIEAALSLAPGAQVVVYHAPGSGPGTSFQALFNAMINDGVTVISNSFGYCEDQTSLADVQGIDTILTTAAAAGISVFNATGDTGSACNNGSANTIMVPADSPHATAVGGTSLTVGPAFVYQSETYWNGASQVPPTGQGGFGTSRFFSRPSYQDGVIAGAQRSVPDVAAPADPAKTGVPVCLAGTGCPTNQAFGGTSLATPTWAALTALFNESAGHSLGFLNPRLYPLAGTTALHSPASMGTDVAHVGLGSPNGNLLSLALTGQTAGPVDATASTVTATAPQAGGIYTGTVPANGTAAAAIVVQLYDAAGNILVGKNVALSAAPGSHAVITPPSGLSSVSNGAVVFTVNDATVESVTFTATADGVLLAQQPTVSFVAPPPAAAGLSPATQSVPADGTSAATITVTLQDAQGQGTPGKRIALSQGAGHSVVSGPTPSVTDSTGRVQFTVADSVAETVTYTATDVSDALPIPGSAQVTFTGSNVTPACGGVPTPTAGFAVSNFATGFPTAGSLVACAGPIGLAFD